MPIFAAAEAAVRRRLRHPPRAPLLRAVLRCSYVVAVTATACYLPFFGDLMGLVSCIGLMPVTFILPCVMWIAARRPRGAERAVNAAIAGGAAAVAVLALVGSARNILVHAREFHLAAGGR